ncbi:MAG: glycoside hydrolase family 5 protein [Archangiaceae bacterium]|nr:glycoside hydrolase family 5 protein [Archangiaceae bacterium]
MRWFGLFLLVSCVPAAPPPPASYSVKSGFLRDPQGRAVILRGVNVSGKHKTKPYFDFHDTPDYQQLRAWGFNSVRFLVSWSAIEPTRDVYDETYLAELRRRVSLATGAGLLVFIDLHQDLYGEGFVGANGAPRWTCDEANYAAYRPVTPWFLNALSTQVIACVDGFWSSKELKAKYASAWRQVAKALKDERGVIGFDPMNEPPWGSLPNDVFEKTRLAPLYRDVLAEVRAERPDWIGFFEPAASRNLGLPTALPRFDEPNIV